MTTKSGHLALKSKYLSSSSTSHQPLVVPHLPSAGRAGRAKGGSVDANQAHDFSKLESLSWLRIRLKEV